MDVEYELQDIVFRWDAEKERTNVNKHDGVSFRQAAEVFFDPFMRRDDTPQSDETRVPIIGMDLKMRLLFVVHIWFEDDHIRIISARKADTAERNRYEDEYN